MTKVRGAIGYFFCNHYMQGIHGGIQSLHAAVEMGLNFPPGTRGFKVLSDWGRSGQPDAILLNAGYASRVEKVAQAIETFNAENNDGIELPYARFHEGIDELNGALTAVALVVPGPWVLGEYTRTPDEVAEALAMGDPVEVAAQLTDWSMGDRLRLLRHGMPLRS